MCSAVPAPGKSGAPFPPSRRADRPPRRRRLGRRRVREPDQGWHCRSCTNWSSRRRRR